jgi:tRNA (guanosine-2'-O-)-methyltransferase
MKTERRLNKIKQVLGYRQPDLKIVLENIHDPHNVSAIFRTCDSVGVDEIYLIYTKETFPKIGKKSSASAYKWVNKKRFTSVEECYESLRIDGFQILATEIGENSKSLWDYDLTGKTAIVFGNEHRGVSKEASEKADGCLLIPMFGMVQSLNVSVSCGITLYEIARQRFKVGHYNNTKFDDKTFEKYLDEWVRK